MLGRIIFRIGRSFLRILLVGWSPGPNIDYQGRLEAVEKMAWATKQKVYRDDKAAESSVPPEHAPEFGGVPLHPSGRPYQTGDSVPL